MSNHSEERPSSRRRTESLSQLLPFRHTGGRDASALSRAGTLVLGTGIPAFEEGNIYIPVGAENELSYTTLDAWWKATVESQKDPKVIVYSIERVLRQILSCSDTLAYGLCAILDKGFETQTFQRALGIFEEQQMWNYLRDQSDVWRQALEKRDTYQSTTDIKIRTVKTILQALPDVTHTDEKGRPFETTATIVLLLGHPDSPWNVAHLGRDTLIVFQKAVEAAVKHAGNRSFSTSYWVRFLNRILLERFWHPRRRGQSLRKFRPIKDDVQRLLMRIEEKGPWFQSQECPKIHPKEINDWNKANTRASIHDTLAIHPKFFVLCTQEDIDSFHQRTQVPTSPMRVRHASLSILEGSSSMPSIARVRSQATPEDSESRQRAESTITLLEGNAPDIRLMALGTHSSVVIPVQSRPPNLPASIEAITGRPNIQDDDDPDTFEAPNDPEGDEDLADDISVDELDAASDDDYDNTQRVRNARRAIAVHAKKDKTCGCDTDRIEQKVRNQIKRDKKLTKAQLMSLMRDFYAATKQSRSTGALPICKSHLVILAGKIGLKTAGVSTQELWLRVVQVCERPNELGDKKLAQPTTHWFTSASKLMAPSDYLGIYRFPTVSHQPLKGWTTQYRVKMAQYYLKDKFEAWDKVGTVNIDCFGWLWEHVPALTKMREEASSKYPTEILDYLFPTTLADLFKLEFDCYLWHQRRVNDKDNLGWLRNCWYSLAQDVVRQDPFYYFLYVILREDNAYKLISYPYYCKYTQPSDKTSFRHIDINIPKLLAEQRGKYQIQGSLSLDDESDSDCTIVVKGFHKDEIIRTWYNRWQDKISNGYVHNMRKVYNKQDEADFGPFEPVPCKAGQVRITQPHLPHGARGPAQAARRTILPWYVRVQDDNSTLEIVEAGTWEELSIAHISKTLPPATPSGYGVQYGKPPYRFPGSGTFISQSPISQALVGRRRWNDYELLDQVDVMLRPKENKLNGIRQSFRKEAREQIPKLWQAFVEREEREFGKFSFFYCKRNEYPQPDPWEGNPERIRHMIRRDKQVVGYAKKLEARRGNHLAKAFEQDESESDVDEE